MRLIHTLSIFLILICINSCSEKQRSNVDANNLLEETSTLRMYNQDENIIVAEILSPEDSTHIIEKYYLVNRGSETPSATDGTIIEVPIKNAIIYTSVHGSAFVELGKSDIIKGVADAQYFALDCVKKGLADGTITDIGISSSPSQEKIADIEADAIFVNIYDGADYRSIEKLGIPIIKMCENLEQSPLGRAEWIKLIGALTGTQSKANEIFNNSKQKYLTLAENAKTTTTHPTVLTENIYEGVWYVSGGGSYNANVYADAGAIYPWRDNKSSGSLNLSFEQVLDKAQNADFWLLKVYEKQLTREELLKMDSRYANFKAVDNGGVYYCDTSVSPIFDETPFHPDILLQEYINIFNRNDKELRYFRPLGK